MFNEINVFGSPCVMLSTIKLIKKIGGLMLFVNSVTLKPDVILTKYATKEFRRHH